MTDSYIQSHCAIITNCETVEINIRSYLKLICNPHGYVTHSQADDYVVYAYVTAFTTGTCVYSAEGHKVMLSQLQHFSAVEIYQPCRRLIYLNWVQLKKCYH